MRTEASREKPAPWSQFAMSRASAGSRRAARRNQRSARVRTCCYDWGRILWCERSRLGELDLPVLALGEHPVDHAAVKVHVGIERAAETLYEAHRRQPPVRAAAALAQLRFDHPQQDVQHGAERLGVVL